MKISNITHLIITPCVLLLSMHCRAAEITLPAPGMLANALGANLSVTSLTIKGEVDVRDFDFIRDNLAGVLTSLDLSGAAIAPYKGEATFTGRTESEANSLPEGALMVSSLTSVKLPASLVEIADGALATTSITNIDLPASLKKIGISAFAGCPMLESVELPAGIAALGAGAFADCTSLASADLSRTALTALPDNTFARCAALTSVKLPASTASIGNGAFTACTSLQTVDFPTAITSIGRIAFYGSALRTANLSGCRKLDTIADWAFADCNALQSVQLPESLASLGKGAFYNNKSLSLTALPDLEKIEDLAFAGIKGIQGNNLPLPDGIEIGDYALSGWSSVQVLTLPNTIERIGTEAMANWVNLSLIEAEQMWSVPLLGNDVWMGVNQPSVTLHASEELADEFKSADQWKDFNIQVYAASVDNAIADGNGADAGIKAWFEGAILHIAAPSDIAAIEIYDTDGRRFTFPTQRENSTSASVDTSAWSVRVLLVRVALDNGTSATFKLAR